METGIVRSLLADFPFQGECSAALETLDQWKNRLLDTALTHPAETLFVVLAGGALVFFLAERDVNDGVNTYDDAFYYISTCLSVGYANVFPITQTGKLVAALVMAVGPSLSSWVIEGRLVAKQAAEARAAGLVAAPPAAPPDLTPVVEKLDQILQELRALRTPAADPG